jgi:hypothetical protein
MPEYIAANPLPFEAIKVGTRVSVPDWRTGTIVGRSNGTVTIEQGTAVDRTGAFVVRVDSTGKEVLHFGYSIGAEVILGPDADKACVQCGATGQVDAPLYARPHPRADQPDTPCVYVRVVDRRYLPEDVHEGDITSDDVRQNVIDCTAVAGTTAVDEAVRAVRDLGLTFEGGDWASDPDGSRDVDYATGERSEVSAHLYGFTDDEQLEIIERVQSS